MSMPTRFDHAVIAVRDLDTAIQQFQHLGFDVQPGGRHTGRGTQNALIRFGLDYVELLAVYDEAEARAAQWQTLLDALGDREASLIGYALATETIEQDAQRFHGPEPEFSRPQSMQRVRPDGHLLSWRTLAPDGNAWRRPWPFLIQWDIPDEERLRLDPPRNHPNGAREWAEIHVATNDLPGVLDIYRNQLGLQLHQLDEPPCQVAHRATFKSGNDTIFLLAPSGDGPTRQTLTAQGEGPFLLSFKVDNLIHTQNFLKEREIPFEFLRAGRGKLILDPIAASGVRIHFVG
jgi:hypothetical protein